MGTDADAGAQVLQVDCDACSWVGLARSESRANTSLVVDERPLCKAMRTRIMRLSCVGSLAVAMSPVKVHDNLLLALLRENRKGARNNRNEEQGIPRVRVHCPLPTAHCSGPKGAVQ